MASPSTAVTRTLSPQPANRTDNDCQQFHRLSEY
uniref:Uncharacterized protein n=2 Tax=Anguilla anguilla TaxID=7936 RepID=A0A0E9UGY3_ANGAN